jgi:hypothetical protein
MIMRHLLTGKLDLMIGFQLAGSTEPGRSAGKLSMDMSTAPIRLSGNPWRASGFRSQWQARDPESLSIQQESLASLRSTV